MSLNPEKKKILINRNMNSAPIDDRINNFIGLK